MRASDRAEMRGIRRCWSCNTDQSRPRSHNLRIQARSWNQVHANYRSWRGPMPRVASRVNSHRETIALRDVIESSEFAHSPSKLTFPMGKDLIGRIRATDLTQMPHLLIAGATGTGKSVFINSLLMGMLFKATPDEMK